MATPNPDPLVLEAAAIATYESYVRCDIPQNYNIHLDWSRLTTAEKTKWRRITLRNTAQTATPEATP